MPSARQAALDAHWMRKAIVLARANEPRTRPNPSVGAILVKNGKMISSGVTETPGKRHAEIAALEKAGTKANGATLYVTLEPCSHTAKRTPPCVPRIIASGVKRVVIAARDENPAVRGKGIGALRRAGITITQGILERETRAFYRAFFHWIRTGKPFITVHIAQTLDGKMTWGNGKRKQVTGRAAHNRLLEHRAAHDAVLVGIGTVKADDPRLTARSAGHDPIRVVLDPDLEIASNAKVLEKGEVMLIYASGKRRTFAPHVRLIELKAKKGRFDLGEVVRALGKQGIRSLYVEGGVMVCRSFLPFAHRIELFLSPKIVGRGRGVFDIAPASRRLGNVRIETLGGDVLISADLQKNI